MSATTVSVAGKTNRTFVLLAIVLGLLGSVLLYAAVSRDGSKTSSPAGGVPVVVAKVEIPARTRITASMVEIRQIPADTRSLLAFDSTDAVLGQVTRFPIAANEHILSSKVVPLEGAATASRSLAFAVPQGKRGFAIRVSEVANAGGLILPGDYVDVVVLYDVEFLNRSGDREMVDAFVVDVLFQNIEVLAVSQTIVDLVPNTGDAEGQRARNTEAAPKPDANTVTLALTPEEAQKLYLAEANGRIRLAVRPFGDSELRPIDPMVKLELLPANLPNPFLQR
jgi:pilus assembly protein CpaB